MNIELRIERLILDGLPVTLSQRAAIQTAFEGEMARLLRDGRLHEAISFGAAIPSMRSPATVDATVPPRQLGAQIARAVYGEIGLPPEVPRGRPPERSP